MDDNLELEDIQSPILRRRPSPYVGCHILLHIRAGAQGRELLRRLAPHVISAAQYNFVDTWLAVALTCSGLRALGLAPALLDTFPTAFREGMASRAASFGDTGENLPDHWEAPYGSGQIHVALTLLSVSRRFWEEKLAFARQQLAELPGVELLQRVDFEQPPDARTPFGYKDGISMPKISGNNLSPISSPEEEIAPGEFVLGYPGEAGRHVPMPQPAVLGRNGTFAGFRKLHSRVAAFRRFLQDNRGPSLSENLLAAKVIGRWRSGAPLVLAPEADDPELISDSGRVNNFDYEDDPSGLRCPLGSHIRRMNPRNTRLAVMSNVKLRRLIRHGTTYGPPLPEGVLEDDGQPRGIFFIFMSATAPETFEFLKKEWIQDGNFLGLGKECDPVAAHHDGRGSFTIPMRPIRRRIPLLETFTLVRGGEYCFLPGISALRWLAEGNYL